MLDEAKELIKAIKVYEVAKDGESGDAEYDAGCELRDAAKDFLLAASARDIQLAELIDRELPDEVKIYDLGEPKVDIAEMVRAAEAELTLLKAKGWTQADFAKALKGLLEK